MDKASRLYLKLRSFFAEARSQFPVALAYLFGSQAIGRAGAQNDYDLAVLFDGKVSTDDRYLLTHQLTEFLDTDVDLARAPVELVYNVIATGQVLYEKDPRTRVAFEAREDYDAGVERYRTALKATERMLAQTRVV